MTEGIDPGLFEEAEETQPFLSTPVDALLASLDPEQQAAVESTAQRIRVIAGAGSGKTRCLTARVARLRERGVSSAAICVVTFSKRAAEELQHRLGALVDGAQIGTLHSLGYQIARREICYRKVADEGVRRRFIRRALIDSRSKEKFGYCCMAIAKAKRTGAPFPLSVRDVACKYQALLQEGGFWDFDDLIVEAVRVLSQQAGSRSRWRGRWEHLLVDEAQDTSTEQWELLGLLAAEDTSVFLVGDRAQGVYSFRGADPEAMAAEADERFGAFTEYGLPTNYRSVSQIVQIANCVDAAGALHLRAHRPLERLLDPPPVTFLAPAIDEIGEAEQIATALQGYREMGVRWGDMAVLYRINAAAAALEQVFLEREIPAVVVAGVSFYARTEIQDVLAYLRLAREGWDDEAAKRVFNKPTRYLGAAFLAELDARGGWRRLLIEPQGFRFSRSFMGHGAEQFLDAIRAIRRLESPGAMVRYVLESVGYRDWLVSEEPDDADEVRGENLDALLKIASRWDSLDEFLEFVAICQKRPTGGSNVGRVQLSTSHRGKGLEWPLVVVAGITTDVWPHKRGDLEEERRVFYVAVTRARDRLLLSCSGRPSVFWTDLKRAVGDAGLGLPGGCAGTAGDARGGADGDPHHDVAAGSGGHVRGESRAGRAHDGESEAGRAPDGDVPGGHR